MTTTPKDKKLKEKVKIEHSQPRSDEQITRKSSETGESSQKPCETSEVVEDKKQMSKAEGCINKEDAEWYQETISNAFDQLKSGLLKDEPLNVLIEKFMKRSLFAAACNILSCNLKWVWQK